MIIVLSDKDTLCYQGILFESKQWVQDSIEFDSNVTLGKHLDGVKKDLLLRNLDYTVRVFESVSTDMTQLEKESISRLRSAVEKYLDNKYSFRAVCKNLLRGKGVINTLTRSAESPELDMCALSIIKTCEDETSKND